MQYEFAICTSERNQVSVSVPKQVGSVLEDSALFHVFVRRRENGNHEVQQQDVRHKGHKHKQDRVRHVSTAHSAVVIHCHRRVKQRPERDRQTSVFVWVVVLVQSREHTRHNSKESAENSDKS